MKKYYTNVFEHAAEGIILSDENARMYLVNPAAREMFGYGEAEMIGQPIDLLIPSRFRERHATFHQDYYRSPAVRKMGQGRDLSAIRKDGSEFPVEVSLSYFRDKNKTFTIAFVMDITLRKEAENKLIQANTDLLQLNEAAGKLNEQLEEKVAIRTLMLEEALHQVEASLQKEKELSDIKSRFVSMASHEFRTPLSTVMFSASLLGKYVAAEDQEKRNQHLLKIKDSVRHLNGILEDFLSLGKLNEGNVEPEFHDFYVRELVEDIVEEMKAQLKPGQEISISAEVIPAVNSDVRLIKNSIINLLSNAIKYSAENTAIHINVRYPCPMLEIEIADNGIGIPDEDKPHLFTSFYRGSNAVNVKGTGLGLLIVKRYMDILGGKVLVESRLNEGTTATIQIPDQHKATTYEQLHSGG